MGETTDRIVDYIDHEREHLGSNLRELEGKVKSTADWRTHFRRHPFLAAGLGVGCGIIAGSLLFPERSRKSSRPAVRPEEYRPIQPVIAHRRPEVEQIRGHWDQIRTALIDLAATRTVDYMDQVIPGFRQHMDRRAAKNGGSTYSSHENGPVAAL